MNLQAIGKLRLPSAQYWTFWLVIGSGVILIAVAVLAAVIMTIKAERPTQQKHIQMNTKPEKAKEKAMPDKPVTLQFVRIGVKMEPVSTIIFPNQWLTVGSGSQADIQLGTGRMDSALYPIHFKISLSKNELLAAAAAGETFVNGIPIRQLGVVSMRSGEKIQAGSFEYRVTITPQVESETSLA